MSDRPTRIKRSLCIYQRMVLAASRKTTSNWPGKFRKSAVGNRCQRDNKDRFANLSFLLARHDFSLIRKNQSATLVLAGVNGVPKVSW